MVTSYDEVARAFVSMEARRMVKYAESRTQMKSSSGFLLFFFKIIDTNENEISNGLAK